MPDDQSMCADARPKRRRIPLRKKLVFAAIACAAFFVIAEFVLWAAGVPTLIEQEDPSRGFSGLVTVFERDGDVYRTRRAMLASTFNDQSFLAKKPANGLRVFCLGGSSSYGFPWGADAAFTALLGEVLAASHPELHVEAVNASGISYAMHRLNIVAGELLKYKPDVFIIYSGHNEFVEPAFFDALKRRGSVHTRAEYVMAHSRVYSGVRTILARVGGAGSAPTEDFGAEVRRDTTRVFSPREKDEIVAGYRQRLERLVRLAQEAGIRVVVSTIPCNLSEWQPEVSGGVAVLSEKDRQAWSQAFGSGKRRVDAKEWEAAKADLEQAARLAPGHAETQFLLGKAYEALERWDDARMAYQRACDTDASPTRRVSGINDAIRDVARRQGVLLVDADRIFEKLSKHGLVGFNLIEDYVHPTQEGHEIIAWHMWDAMERAGWLGGKAPAKRPVFDRVIAERRKRPKTKSATWFYNQGVVLANQGRSKEAIQKFREALKISPDYVGAMRNLGRLFTESGQAAEAVDVLRRAIEIDPGAELHTTLGNALRMLGRPEEAVAAHEEALRLKPDYANAHNNLANALLDLRRFKEAIKHYEEALRLNPGETGVHTGLANVLLRLGRVKEAVEHYEKALELKPGLPQVHHNLAYAFVLLHRPKEVIAHYEKALRLKPDYLSARNNLALALQRQGRFREAAGHLNKALQLKPDYIPAVASLAWLLATCPDADVRDGQRAVTLARRLSEATGHKNPDALRTLAAAHAEAGSYKEAVRWQEKAIQLSPERMKNLFRQHLELYRSGKPYHMSAPPSGGR